MYTGDMLLRQKQKKGFRKKCLKKKKDGHLQSMPMVTSGEEEQAKTAVLCASCRSYVADSADKIAVNGQHAHTFANPGGFVFEIACFSGAPGCVPAAGSSGEFTWFVGYKWRIGVCRSCMAHLGWQFFSASDMFFGLIIQNIIEWDHTSQG